MPRVKRVGWVLGVGLVGLSVIVSEAHAQSSSTNPYRASFGWEKLPDGRAMGTVSGVFPDPDGRHLWILDRCGANQCAGTDLDPILKFDLDGNLVDSFGAGLFGFPHGFFLDHEGFLWVTDGGSHGDARATLGESLGIGHQVLKLNQQGDVVMRLGEAGIWGEDANHLNGPSGVVVAPNGDIWVSDGHRGGNNRIVKFASDGTFLLAVGGVGSGEGGPGSDPHHQDGQAVLGRRTSFRRAPARTWEAGAGIDRSLGWMVRTGPPDDWRSNLGWEKGIRIGDLKTEQAWVTHFIPQHDEDVGAGIEFLGVDFDGNIYAGEVSRRRLVRYVPFRPPEVGGR